MLRGKYIAFTQHEYGTLVTRLIEGEVGDSRRCGALIHQTIMVVQRTCLATEVVRWEGTIKTKIDSRRKIWNLNYCGNVTRRRLDHRKSKIYY